MRRRLAALAVLAALAGCGVRDGAGGTAAPTTTAPPPPLVAGGQPAPSGLIVFTSPREERERLHAVLANGFGKHPLADVPAVEATDPAFSPDGALLAWLGTRDGPASVWVSGADGTLAEELPGTEGASCPSWTPDGRAVLYLTGAGTTEPSLRLAGVDGGRLTLAVPFPPQQLGCGAFLPGDRVVVERTLGGDVELWTFGVGSADPDRLAAMEGCRAVDPVPSPDGTLVGFTTRCRDPGDDGLWMVPATGGVPAPVVRGATGAFSWSPDARWVVYDWTSGGRTELRIADTDGSDVHTVVEAPSAWPTWAPPAGGGAIAP